MDNIFQNGISIWHLQYTIIHNHLKIYYLHYLSGMLEDYPLKCAYFDRLQAAVVLIKSLLSKYANLIILKNFASNKRTLGCDLPCTKFVKLILRKIIRIVATRCHILKRKCTKFDFGSGSAPE